MTEAAPLPRKLNWVHSGRLIPYVKACLTRLFRGARETINLVLLIEGHYVAAQLKGHLRRFALNSSNFFRILDQDNANGRAAAQLAFSLCVTRFSVGALTLGNTTDPSLYATEGHAVIVIDPNVHIPHRLMFEAMRQRSFC